ncbi:MAG: FecR family protein, partial [Bacteroidales bacterium]|nr:FecR family protein [Bacteroidales bacterium]
MTDHDYTEYLIIRYLSNEASAEENDELKELLEKDPELRKHFIEVRDVWNVTNSKAFDAAKAFTQFKHKTRIDQAKGKQRKLSWFKYAGIAASLIILITVGQYFLSDDEPAIQYYTYETQSGERKLITLPDSSKIWMHANSVLSYSANFNSKDRKVNFKGEAFFDVKHK